MFDALLVGGALLALLYIIREIISERNKIIPERKKEVTRKETKEMTGEEIRLLLSPQHWGQRNSPLRKPETEVGYKIIELPFSEAQKMAREIFGQITPCCYVGSLEEVTKHGEKEHNIPSNMGHCRLDETRPDMYDWGKPPRGIIFVNKRNEYWFVCLETHWHEWKRQGPYELYRRLGVEADEMVCPHCGCIAIYNLRLGEIEIVLGR